MEIIVVENGSSDATVEIARGIAGDPAADGRLRPLHSERGVSRAKNAGLRAVSPDADRVVLCDADTRLGPHFLHHLNTWLNRHGQDGLSVGASTRRFEARGYLRQGLRWLVEALMPLRYKPHRAYDVVR